MLESYFVVKIAVFILIFITCITITGLLYFKSVLIKLIILEVLTHLIISSIALWSLVNNQSIFIDVCLPLALIMFLSIVAYYQFILSKGNRHG